MLTASIIAASPSQAGVVAGPIVNPANGHYYYLLSNNSWTASEAEAVTMGGHLATIRNAAEDDWVYNNFSNYGGIPRSLWIGLNDLATVGTFVWSSGESSTYTNWFHGDPNFIGTERYVGIFDSTSNGPRKWANWTNTNLLYGVVEVARPQVYFYDDFESGLNNWNISGTWGLTTSDYRSSAHSLTDSPSGNYPSGTNSTVTLAHPIDLSGSTNPVLTFWQKFFLQWTNFGTSDSIRVEVSQDGGVNWTGIYSATRSSSTWTKAQIDLTPYKAKPLLIRFRLDGHLGGYDGWYIDDVEIKEKDTSTIQFPFFDSFENGLTNWEVSGRDWALITNDYRSAGHSITDSPDGNYPASANSAIMIAHPIDLSGSTNPVLTFWQKFSLQWTNFGTSDSINVEVSQDGGLNWTGIYATTRSSSTWTKVQIDLAPYKAKPVLVRFRLDGHLGGYDGWYIDDVSIYDLATYVLTVTKVGTAGDTVTLDTGNLAWNGNVGIASYNGSTKVTLTAQASLGSVFAGWSDSCTGIGSCIVTMNQARNVSALFTQLSYNVTASVTGGTGGSISPASSTIYYGSPITFTITPNSGYTINNLTDNGTTVTATPLGNGSYTYTISSVTAVHNVEATFAGSGAAPVPALSPGMLAGAGLALFGMLRRRKA